MSQTPYIIASFALVFIGTAAVIFSSYMAMRRAEKNVENLSRKPGEPK
ncbi:hypothetical protein [Parasphingorhabdus halotolerans]|uniref:Heme exporter protein D n=1 Tax=Parasphingorhabdus halotolerans TaxID=2725558 RepID=A0A6H2DJI1_9SPHN|nr:hypothetical protein [Parasphingorhabdus halotolerans]QJB67911.1 hypothetical protein HF685_00120 [Parasphingorhabdus halotolerans]